MNSKQIAKLMHQSDGFALLSRKGNEILTVSYLPDEEVAKLVCAAADFLMEKQIDMAHQALKEGEFQDIEIDPWSTKH